MIRNRQLLTSPLLSLPLLAYAQPPGFGPGGERTSGQRGGPGSTAQEFNEPSFGGGRGFGGGGGFGGPRMADRNDFPMWSNPEDFESDTFTFARIRYTSRNAGGWGNRWSNDYPDSDWNFSYRLSEMTTMHVDPFGRLLDLTDPELFDYPFIFMNGVGTAELSAEEAAALRKYLLRGGFMMVDDFWGESEWDNMAMQMDKVLPGQKPVDLPLSHPIFHLVYDLKEKPQVPDIRTWRAGSNFEFRHAGPHGDKLPHFQAYFDEHNRMVALLCHNNDLGDGWEREGENHEYFETFSVPWSYPMGINIITYAMTH